MKKNIRINSRGKKIIFKRLMERWSRSGLFLIGGIWLTLAQNLNISLPNYINFSSTTDFYQPAIELHLNQDFPLQTVHAGQKIEIVLSKHEQEEKVRQEKEKIELENRQRQLVSRLNIQRTSGVSFAQKRALVKQTALKYGIDWKILEAVWQVESGKSWDTSRRSYAGAIGPLQFMPATFRAYAQDGNGDGKKEIYRAEDALASAANLLAQSGLRAGRVDEALFRYNHSLAYVKKVKRVAASLSTAD